MKTYFILAFLLTIHLGVFSQFTESYFKDEEIKRSRVYDFVQDGNDVIFGGRVFDSIINRGSITKIDTNGTIIWTTADSDSIVDGYVDHLILSDSFVYASFVIVNWPFYQIELWKVNASTGDIIYKKPYFENMSSLSFFQDYDSTMFLLGYRDRGHVSKFVFIKKINGDTLSTHDIAHGWSIPFCINRDSSGDIFYAFRDTVFKVSALNPDSIIWQKSYPTRRIYDFQEIYVDDNDSVYLFGKSSSGQEKILSINAITGSENWYQNALFNTSAKMCIGVKDQNGFLITSWRQINTGGNSWDFWTVKMNKITGTIAWATTLSMSNAGSHDEGPISFELDSLGDVYITGYYKGYSFNYSASWAIMKINGSTGQKLWDVAIAHDTSRLDRASIGIGALIINQKPYFIGNLQMERSSYLQKTTLVKLSSDSGIIELQKTIGRPQPFTSRVIDIKKHGDFETVTMSQRGRFVEIVLYNYAQEKRWTTFLKKDYLLNGSLIQSRPDSTILIVASTLSRYNSTTIDSVFLFLLSNNGDLIHTESFKPTDPDFEAYHILEADTTSYLIYKSSYSLFFRAFTPSSLGPKISTTIHAPSRRMNPKQVINYSQDSLLFFGFSTYLNRVLTVGKTTGSYTFEYRLPDFRFISSILESDSNTVIISGTNQQDQGYLARFDYSIMDTLWTKSYDIDDKIMHTINNDDSSIIYLTGTHLDTLYISKINQNNGDLIWQYIDTSSLILKGVPTDILYDQFRGHILYSGFQADPSTLNDGKSIFITTLDTNGILVNNLIKPRTIEQHNEISCIEKLYTGSIWAGGNLNDSVLDLSGILLKTNSCASFFTDVRIACDSFTWIDGNTYTSSTDTTFHVIRNANTNGCDSVITLDLTISHSTITIDSISTCDSLTWINGVTYYASNHTAVDSSVNSSGCDSTVLLNLTILNKTFAVDSVTACESFTWINGVTYTTNNNTAIDTLVNTNGCDSIVRLDLIINNVDTSVVRQGLTLTAQASNASYQWMFCSTNSQIPGQTNAKYVITQSGEFAVKVTQNGCVKKSRCFTFLNVGINEIDINKNVEIYPTPTSSTLNIKTQNFKIAKIQIRDNSGKIVKTITSNFKLVNVENLPVGVYHIELIGDGETVNKTFIKQ